MCGSVNEVPGLIPSGMIELCSVGPVYRGTYGIVPSVTTLQSDRQYKTLTVPSEDECRITDFDRRTGVTVRPFDHEEGAEVLLRLVLPSDYL